jgi:hypothetical protein
LRAVRVVRERGCECEARSVLFRIVIQAIDVTAAQGKFKRSATRPGRQCAKPLREPQIVFGREP